LAKIEKPHEVGFILRKINLMATRNKNEVEGIFFLYGKTNVKLLCPLELKLGPHQKIAIYENARNFGAKSPLIFLGF
jgi:hypothetical protein